MTDPHVHDCGHDTDEGDWLPETVRASACITARGTSHQDARRELREEIIPRLPAGWRDALHEPVIVELAPDIWEAKTIVVRQVTR